MTDLLNVRSYCSYRQKSCIGKKTFVVVATSEKIKKIGTLLNPISHFSVNELFFT